MSDKIMLWIGITAILIAGFAFFLIIVTHNCDDWPKICSKEIVEKDLLIKEKITVCSMPRDCYESDEAYRAQFLGGYIPEIVYECLIYCYKQGGLEYEFLE